MSTSHQRKHAEKIYQNIFLLVLLTYVLILVFSLSDLPTKGRLFPIIILAGTLLMWLLKTLSTLIPKLQHILELDEKLHSATTGTQSAGSNPSPIEEASGEVSSYIAWVLVFAAIGLMYLIGFLPGTVVSVFCYLRLVCSDSWLSSTLTAGLTGSFIYAIFVRAMHIELGWGVAGSLFGLR